jgi:hypothetical protein
MDRKDYLQIINNTLVNKDEYNFEDKSKAIKFANEVLSEAEDEFSREGYHHKYADFKDFLYTHHVDSIAYFIYEDNYSD